MLILLVVILILPEGIVNKISSVAVAIGILFTAYTLWHDSDNEKKAARQREIDNNNEYWNKIYTLFITEPKLASMHNEIFGNNLPTNEHAMFSIMMQTVESIAESDEEILESSWIHTIRRWISHPMFKIFWKENMYDYTEKTRYLISSVMKEHSY